MYIIFFLYLCTVFGMYEPMNLRKYIVLMLLTALPVMGQAATKGLKFFYHLGERVDRFLLQNVDTDYIALPEYSWRVAYTNTMVGINSYYRTNLPGSSTYRIALLMHTTPSVDLGFYAGYRGFGAGYSWDALNAYSHNFNLSLGSKSMGIDFRRQVSSNISGRVTDPDAPKASYIEMPDNLLAITNMNLTAWYALNSEHYSHNAAVKQSYIQKKSAGSLLLSLSYLYTELSVRDTLKIGGQPVLSMLLDSVKSVTSHQVAVGIGYGINYTPNKGKVVLHAAANLQLVCYSINQVSMIISDSIRKLLPGEPKFNIKPHFPVHVTGNVRAAVSWEINKWVHLSLWAQADHIRFQAHKGELSNALMKNWNWHVHLNVGVRFGAGRKRVREALADQPLPEPYPFKPTRLPKWITEYFYSPGL